MLDPPALASGLLSIMVSKSNGNAVGEAPTDDNLR